MQENKIKMAGLLLCTLYLPDSETIYFLARRQERDTCLSARFKLNIENPNTLQFCIPKFPPINEIQRQWTLKERGFHKIVSKMYRVNLRDSERFYLQFHSLHVPRVTNYEY